MGDSARSRSPISSGEVETRVHALNNVGTSLLFADRPGGRERMEESLALALEHGFHDHAARAYTNFAEYAVVFKDFALAERLLSEGIAFAIRHDLDSAAQYLLGRQAQLRMEQGRFREAETIANGVMDLERLPLVMHLPALTVLGRVRVRLGEPERPRAAAAGAARGAGDRRAAAHPPGPLRAGGGGLARRGRPAPVTSSWRPRGDATSRISIPGTSASWRSGGGDAEMARPLPVSKARIPSPRAAELRGDPAAAAEEWSRAGASLRGGARVDAGPRRRGRGGAGARGHMLEEIEARPAAMLARRLAQRIGVAVACRSRGAGHMRPPAGIRSG